MSDRTEKLRFRWEDLLTWAAPLEVSGDPVPVIEGIGGLRDEANQGLSFIFSKKHKEALLSCKAAVVLWDKDLGPLPEASNKVFLTVEDGSRALDRIAFELEKRLLPAPAPGIHPTAIIADSAKIDPSVSIGPAVVIEDDVEIGPGCRIAAGAFIGRGSQAASDVHLAAKVIVMPYTLLGNRARIGPGVVLGSDGFGYETRGGIHLKSPQIGVVEIGEDVEVGANTTIDRARVGRTVIGPGTKIDNLVQIGHNVRTGKGCIIVAQVGISGSTELGDYVIVGGQAGIAGHLKIGSGSKIGAQSGIARTLPADSFEFGSPSLPYLAEQKFNVFRKKLPDFMEKIRLLESRMKT